MPEGLSEEISKEIDPRVMADNWAKKGMPDAAKIFAERAGLDDIATDKLLLTAYEQERLRLENVRNLCLGHSEKNMLDDKISDRPLYEAFEAMATGHGKENNQNEYLASSMATTKRLIEVTNREWILKLQANESVRNYLSQELKKQEAPLPHIPTTR